MAATSVGAGILISRLAGVVRVALFAKYFGQQSEAADAFVQAFKIPNLLQNLFGEGALSGSFIPVHAGLRARGEHDAAAQMARTFFALLTLAISILVLLGVLAAPLMVTLIAPGFTGPKRDLTIHLVRVLFPGAGFLVASAWCLGVLNSHGKFLLSYTAPVAWNAAMIGTLLYFGDKHGIEWLAMDLAWGSVAGSFLQFAVQAPMAFGLSRHPGRAGADRAGPPGDAELRTDPHQPRRGPADRVHRRVDRQLAAHRSGGRAVERAAPLHAAGQSLRHLDLRRGAAGDVERRRRRRPAWRRCAPASTRPSSGWPSSSIPSAVAFVALGDVIAAALLQHGRFEAARRALCLGHPRRIGGRAARDARWRGSTRSRTMRSATPKKPLRFALVRLVVVTIARLHLRARAAAEARHRAAMGRGGADGVGRRRRLDRVRAAARQPQSAHRPDRALAASHAGAALDRRGCRRRDRVGRPAGAAAARSARPRGAVVLPAFGAAFLGAAFLLRLSHSGAPSQALSVQR